MLKIHIPGRKSIEIHHIILDYNGTIAQDGKLLPGISEQINVLSDRLSFYVITADTFGTVEEQLQAVNCEVIKIGDHQQDQQKLDFLNSVGADTSVCIGNGMNDRKMLKTSAIGIALIQAEGTCVDAILSANIVCTSITDALSLFQHPDRLRATLRN